MLLILGWSLRNHPKWTGSRLEINILVHFPLFKLNIDNIDIININNINNINDINDININDINIGLEPQKPSQMQRSR